MGQVRTGLCHRLRPASPHDQSFGGLSCARMGKAATAARRPAEPDSLGVAGWGWGANHSPLPDWASVLEHMFTNVTRSVSGRLFNKFPHVEMTTDAVFPLIFCDTSAVWLKPVRNL